MTRFDNNPDQVYFMGFHWTRVMAHLLLLTYQQYHLSHQLAARARSLLYLEIFVCPQCFWAMVGYGFAWCVLVLARLPSCRHLLLSRVVKLPVAALCRYSPSKARGPRCDGRSLVEQPVPHCSRGWRVLAPVLS